MNINWEVIVDLYHFGSDMGIIGLILAVILQKCRINAGDFGRGSYGAENWK